MFDENSLKKNTLFLTMGTLLNKGLQFFAIPFFSRWLSTEGYGRFDLMYTYVSLLLPIITISLEDAVFRFCVDVDDEGRKRKYITTALIVNAINAFVCVISISFLVDDQCLVIAFCLFLVGEVFSQYLRGYLRGIKRLDIYSIAMVVNTIVMIIFVTIFVYYCGLGIEGMLLGYAFGTWCGNIIVCFYSKLYKFVNFTQFSIITVKEMINYSLPLVPNVLSWWIMNASDRQIINWFFGDAANGIYAIAHKIPALCSVIFNMFTISWQQDVSLKINEKEKAEYFNKVLNEMYRVLAIVCSGLFAGSFVLYRYVFDNKYSEAQLYSPIMILAAAVMALSQFYGGIQIALKHSKENGLTTVIGAGINILVHIALIKYVGLFAAALSTLFGNYVILLLRKFMIKKVYVARLEKRWLGLLLAVFYFFTMAYVNRIMILNIINLILAGLMAYIGGKDIVKDFFRKKSRREIGL